MKKPLVKKIIAYIILLTMIQSMFAEPILLMAANSESILKDYDAMEMDEILDSGEALTWVFAGDSITHNAGWAQGMNGYAEWFEQYLYDIDRGTDTVINTAWGGADIQDFLYEKDTPSGNGIFENAGMGLENMITKYNPDVVFIKLGMNNRSMNKATFLGYYEKMLDGIYAEGALNGKKPKVIILTPTPTGGENLFDDLVNPNFEETRGDYLRRFSIWLSEFAEQKDLLFCDLRTEFLKELLVVGDDYRQLFFTDPSDGQIHPNAAGQYLIFNILSKTLGIYDETKPIYQLEYEDIFYETLYTDKTNVVTYSNSYASMDYTDKTEMNSKMPELSGLGQTDLLASVDFTSTNGTFEGGNTYAGATRVDLTDASFMNNALTLNEVQSMNKEFSIVFRAKLMAGASGYQPVLFVSSNGAESYADAWRVGVPSDSNQFYYEISSGGTEKTTSANTFNVDSNRITVDGNWHTFAIVQSETQLIYYIDGVAIATNAYCLKDGHAIKDGFLNTAEDDFVAYIGSFHSALGGYNLKGNMDYYQLYNVALTTNQVKTLADANPVASSDESVKWSDATKQNTVWAMVGAEQLAGYEGPVANRSLKTQLDNIFRTASSQRHRRTLNYATPGVTLASMSDAEFETYYNNTFNRHNYDVLFVLPEVSEVYAKEYNHATDSQALLAQYKKNIESLIAKNRSQNSDVVTIMWTPLASGDDKINGYIDAYAEVVRQITARDKNILLFDANQFMNDHIKSKTTLKQNWFGNDMYLTPLAVVDLVRQFYSATGIASPGDAQAHNLRYTSDTRIFKGTNIYDGIAPDVSVADKQITVDIADIKEAYPQLANIKIAVMPYADAGNYHKDIYYLSEKDMSVTGTIYRFEVPCANPVIAVFGELNGFTYRFKDTKVAVSTTATLEWVKTEGVFLDSLEIIGAPEFDFDKNTSSYMVTLYDYQKQIQILASAQKNLTITVGQTTLKAGENSPLISVDDGDVISVTVSGEINGKQEHKTYTLTISRPEYPDIIVTEVMIDGYKDSATGLDRYDLIEIYNASGKNLNLKDYSVGYKVDFRGSGTANYPYINYYFTGNNEVFQSRMNVTPTYTGINEITKWSSYWGDTAQEPTTIDFPKDSTMVIWVKHADDGLEYDDLIQTLKSNAESYTKTVNGQAVVPTEKQLVVAEVPKGETLPTNVYSSHNAASKASKYFYLNNDATELSNLARSWMFILKQGAMPAANGAITEAGNDIVSAAKQERVASTDKLSGVFSYSTRQGMSVLRKESPNGNLTTFGAIEYWQKPLITSDKTAPVVKVNTSPVATKGSIADIKLSVSDETEVRVIELFVRRSGESTYTKVTKDYVLENCVENSGVAKAQKSAEYVYSVGTFSNMVEYYGTVTDGTNVTSFGSVESPLTIVRGAVKEYEDISTTPKMEGFLFAGWFTEENCMTPLDKTNAEGSGWAKFVAEDILKVKAQASQEVLSNGKYAMRFITSVDSLKYRSVGFEVSYDDDGTTQTVSSNTTTVYERIHSTTDGAEYAFSPKVVDVQSEYFVTVKLAVPAANISKDYTVRAYWVTLDGTKVYGPSRCVAVVDGQDDSALNMSFKNTANAEVGDTVKAEYNGTNATATVIGVDDSMVHVRIDVDKTTLKSATLFTFKSTDGSTTYGSEIYRNLYTSYTGTPDTSWYDVYHALGETEFVIATNADLYGIASIAKATDDFAGKTIYVVSDIEANDGYVAIAADRKSATWSGNTSYMWTPIGVNNTHPFEGTFDGQGHTISGIYYNRNVVVGGMFTHVAPGGVVKNFRLVNSYISTQSTGYTGSIAGKCAGVIESVYSDAFVRGTNNVGGLVGEAGYASNDANYVMNIRNSWFDGAVYATSNATGGIVGYLYKVANKYGSSPEMVTADITDCLMSGTVNSTGTYVGGIIGDTQHGDGNFTLNVERCLVTGTVATTGALKGAIWGRVASGVCSIVDSYVVSECGLSTLVGSGTVSGNSTDRFVAKASITGLKAEDHVVMERLGKEKWMATSSTPELVQFVKHAVDVDWYYDNPDATEFVISTAEELYGLGIVSQSTNFAGKTIKLANDIVLNEGDALNWKNGANSGLRQWNSIGSNDAATQFAGTFDGQGHTISGLYGQYSTICNGLFATVCETGLVTNFRLENSFVTSSNGYLGSVAGRSYGGTFTKIYSDAHVVGTGLLKPDGVNVDINTGYIGGMVGVAIGVTDGKEDVLFSQCWFDGTVNSTTGRNGGIAGAIHSYPYSTEQMIVEDCLFTGSVATTVVRHTIGVGTGGLVGATIDVKDTLKFKNCVAVDDVKILVNTGHFLGAIMGAMGQYTSTGISLDNCYVIGNSVPPIGMAAHSAFTGTVTGSATVVNELSGAASITNTSDNWTLVDGVPTLKIFAE